MGAAGLLLAVAVDPLLRHRLWALPALIVLPGAWFVRSDHIFSPIGVLGMTLIGLTTGYLAWIEGEERTAEIRWHEDATSGSVKAS